MHIGEGDVAQKHLCHVSQRFLVCKEVNLKAKLIVSVVVAAAVGFERDFGDFDIG